MTLLHVCVAGQGFYSSFVYAFTDVFFVLVSSSLKSFSTEPWLKCIKWDCGEQYQRFFWKLCSAAQNCTRDELLALSDAVTC